MKLSNKNIADVIKNVENFFESLNVSNNDKVKICFLLEESLLRFQEKFGEDHEFNFVTKKWLGTPKVLIKVKGKPYNPIDDDSDENIFSESVMRNLLNYEQAGTIYRYESGYNEISVFSTQKIRKFKIPGGSVTISILLAIFAALIVQNFSPQVQKFIVDDIATPILDKLLGAIIACSIPMIFISIVASICSIENVTMLNNAGGKILKRFFVIMLSISVVSIFVNAIFFPVIDFSDKNVSLMNAAELQKIFELFLDMIPQNIVEPFLNKNILQIIVLALLTGVVVTTLGERVVDFKNWVLNLRQIIFRIFDIIFKVIPTVIFLCIFKTMITESPTEILTVWKMIAAEYILYLLTSGVVLLRVKILYGVKILDFLKKIYPAFLISFTTGSGMTSMAKNIEICKKNLNVEKNFCEFYIPLSHALCPTTMIIGIVTCVFFAANFSNEQISIANLFIIIFLAIQFSLASVGGNGGMLAILGLLFTQLNLSLDAIGTIMVADIFVVNISGVFSLIIRDCDLIDMSHKIKFS